MPINAPRDCRANLGEQVALQLLDLEALGLQLLLRLRQLLVARRLGRLQVPDLLPWHERTFQSMPQKHGRCRHRMLVDPYKTAGSVKVSSQLLMVPHCGCFQVLDLLPWHVTLLGHYCIH